MSDETREFYQDWRLMRKQERQDRRETGTEQIANLPDKYHVEQFTETHYRVRYGDKAVDLYPTNRRYHVLSTGKRGHYEYARQTCDKWLEN